MHMFEAAQGKEKQGRVTAVKTTRITVERDTIMVVRRARIELAWCPVCRTEVEVITLGRESLAEVLAVTPGHGSRPESCICPTRPTDPPASASLLCLSVSIRKIRISKRR